MTEDDPAAPRTGIAYSSLTTSAFLTLVLGAATLVEPPALAAQGEVTWRIDSVTARNRTNDSLWVAVTATLANGWHLYSIVQPAGGPIATAFSTGQPAEWIVDGPIRAPQSRVVKSLIGDPQYLYEGAPHFRIPLRRLVRRAAAPVLSIRFQICTDRVCNPPRSIDLAVPAPTRTLIRGGWDR